MNTTENNISDRWGTPVIPPDDQPSGSITLKKRELPKKNGILIKDEDNDENSPDNLIATYWG